MGHQLWGDSTSINDLPTQTRFEIQLFRDLLSKGNKHILKWMYHAPWVGEAHWLVQWNSLNFHKAVKVPSHDCQLLKAPCVTHKGTFEFVSTPWFNLIKSMTNISIPAEWTLETVIVLQNWEHLLETSTTNNFKEDAA